MKCSKCGLDNEGVFPICVDCGYVFGVFYKCSFGREYELSSLDIRIVARLLDLIFAFAPAILMYVGGWENEGIIPALCWGLPYFYFADAFRGQSLGKRISRIMVIDSISGKPCDFGQSFSRSFLLKLGVIDWLFALFGGAN
jgi:uncharacterized RDD family membrane protein YckC